MLAALKSLLENSNIRCVLTVVLMAFPDSSCEFPGLCDERFATVASLPQTLHLETQAH